MGNKKTWISWAWKKHKQKYKNIYIIYQKMYLLFLLFLSGSKIAHIQGLHLAPCSNPRRFSKFFVQGLCIASGEYICCYFANSFGGHTILQSSTILVMLLMALQSFKKSFYRLTRFVCLQSYKHVCFLQNFNISRSVCLVLCKLVFNNLASLVLCKYFECFFGMVLFNLGFCFSNGKEPFQAFRNWWKKKKMKFFLEKIQLIGNRVHIVPGKFFRFPIGFKILRTVSFGNNLLL